MKSTYRTRDLTDMFIFVVFHIFAHDDDTNIFKRSKKMKSNLNTVQKNRFVHYTC